MTPRKKTFLVTLIILLILAIGFVIWSMNRPISPVVLTEQEKSEIVTRIENAQENADYEAGGKKLILSQREINGLFHQNTDLGSQIRFEFAQDAVHARVQYQLDEDFPILPGKKIKAKARLFVQEISAESPTPSIVLDDVTLWGISLPNAWLGELKGTNLFDSFGDNLQGNALSKGIESLKVVPGALEITFAE